MVAIVVIIRAHHSTNDSINQASPSHPSPGKIFFPTNSTHLIVHVSFMYKPGHMHARLTYLFERYTAGNCTEAEKIEYLEMVKQDAYADALQELILAEVELGEADRQMTAEESAATLRSILQQETPVRKIAWGRWVAAAAVILLLGAGAWFWGDQQKISHTTAQAIQPGSNKATLTLADGSIVTLDSIGHQTIQQGGTAITQSGGQLQYNVQNNTSSISYNTLSIPRGGQFKITLPDGTNAWLNAASSLRYPTAFTGKERMVEVTGEAYFEVAKDAAKPFLVKANNGVTVQVLGTSFNINAYADEEAINTTLLEGSVKIWKDEESVILSPGQQVRIKAAKMNLMKDVNVNKVIAWKNGLFNFEDDNLGEVMRQIARWYDVEVVFEAGIPERLYWGEIRRNTPLNKVLEVLEMTGARFRIESNRKIIVMP